MKNVLLTFPFGFFLMGEMVGISSGSVLLGLSIIIIIKKKKSNKL